jgi:gustatory receptor
MQLVKPLHKQTRTTVFKVEDDDIYTASFLCAIKPGKLMKHMNFLLPNFKNVSIAVILFSQMFGLFPLSGLCSKDPTQIKFTWFSIRTLFSLSFFVGASIFGFLVLQKLLQAGPLTPSNIVGVIFYMTVATISVVFFKVAMQLNSIMQRWRQVEKSLQISKFREVMIHDRWSLRKRIIVCMPVTLVLALIEHLFSVAVQVQRNVYENKICNWTVQNHMEDFVTKHLVVVFSAIKYNHFYAIIAEYLNFSFTFYWNFLDIFLMMISIGLSYNYERINNRMKFFKERTLNDKIWAEVRNDYNQVSELLKFVNENLDKMIVLACFNSYFILVQLLNLST